MASNKSNSGGCFSNILGGLFWIVVIAYIMRGCTGNDGDANNNQIQTTNSEEVIIENYTDNMTEEYYDSSNNTESISLTQEAQVMEMLYFHKFYTDIGTVSIHNFLERYVALNYMALIASDKSVFDSGCWIDYQNNLIGNDYYHATVSPSMYYYVGQLKDNRPHGFGAIMGVSEYGTMEGKTVFYYVGNFKDGMKDGFGINFNVYQHDVEYDVNLALESGLVSSENKDLLTHYLVNNVEYEGYWKENKRDGKGNSYYLLTLDGSYLFLWDLFEVPADGYIYGIVYPNVIKGEYENDKLSGNVKEYASNSLIYKGEMKNGMHNGKGETYYGNGQVEYKGEFKNDEWHGYGTYYAQDGSIIYSGEWDYGDYAH